MASLREIRRKIKSVRSTEQITKAMKMIAAARMRRAQASILASRPFAEKMEEVVCGLAALERESLDHPFFKPASAATMASEAGRPSTASRSGIPSPEGSVTLPRVGPRSPAARPDCGAGLILVAADKGLCGAFNANTLRSAVEWIRGRQERPVRLAAVGRKARDFALRLQGASIVYEMAGIFPKVSFAHAELLGQAVISAYLEGRVCSVTAIYNEFRSVVSQRVVKQELLPIPIHKENVRAMDFRFEPERRRVLAALLPRYLKAQLYRILLESQAAELAARMNAMDAASKNAGELIDSLTLSLNRTRQSLITREIAELVGGAEALAA
ncbi:MAG: ATP synthase F1 subunit gamma [Elusimicrobia bacterium]|nr:ATP synthase F1 subunit gamma [Elusimicrobiota bacterium]